MYCTGRVRERKKCSERKETKRNTKLKKDTKLQFEKEPPKDKFYYNCLIQKKKKKEKNKWFHGLGLSNVKDTVVNYGGAMFVSNTIESYETMIQVPIREE